jgi:hypothetical protein
MSTIKLDFYEKNILIIKPECSFRPFYTDINEFAREINKIKARFQHNAESGFGGG